MSNPTPLPADHVVMEAFRQSIPGIKTQAQFNAFILAFDALRLVMNAIFEGDEARALEGRGALEKALDVARKVTELSQRLEEVPEAAEANPNKAQFTEEPLQFREYDVQKKLLVELELLSSNVELVAWYQSRRAEIDRVVSRDLRNILLDSIRAKKVKLQAQEGPES